MGKFIINLFCAFTIVLSVPVVTSAHVVVKPAQVAPAARQVFTMGVPNEHDTPVVNVRLVIPDGLKSVRPYVKAGWNIEIKTTGEGEEAKVTEIIWAGGQIPVDLRDEFLFSAQAPADTAELQWKAYEIYANGTVVAWDQAPKEGDESVKPYSITKIAEEPEAETKSTPASNRADMALALSSVSLLLAIALPVLRKK